MNRIQFFVLIGLSSLVVLLLIGHIFLVRQTNFEQNRLAAAQQAYDLVNGRFAVGFASIVDVTTAQAQLVQAQSQRAQAIVSLSLRKRAVAYALGFDPGQPLP